MTWLALLVLASCVTAEPAPGFRDPARAVASSGVFVPRRFAGEWQLVAAFGEEAACGPLEEIWTVEAGRYQVRGTRCADGRPAPVGFEAALTGPGRIVEYRPEGTRPVWILWIDADGRVAALGEPDGQGGRIIARPGAARPDLVEAARKVLSFNGYDISRLHFVQ